MAKDGYDLILVARRKQLLKKAKVEFEKKYKVSVKYIKLDLSNLKGVKLLCNTVKNVDLLVNNAGVGLFSDFLKSSIDRDLFMMDLNMKSVYYLTKIFGERMVKMKNGGIINIASLAAYNPYPYIAIYSATKSFVLSLTEAVSKELEDKGVRIMTLCPGTTNTEFLKLHPLGPGEKNCLSLEG